MPPHHVRRALAALSEVRTFEKDAVIVGIGPSRRSLFLLTRGLACMVRSYLGQDTEIAHFGAGDLVGEFSYVLRRAGQTLIYAVEPVEAQVIDEDTLRVWLASGPGLRERFYQSLTAHAAQRSVACAVFSAATAAAPACADAALADWAAIDSDVTPSKRSEDYASDGRYQSGGWRQPSHQSELHAAQ